MNLITHTHTHTTHTHNNLICTIFIPMVVNKKDRCKCVHISRIIHIFFYEQAVCKWNKKKKKEKGRFDESM